MNTTAVTFPAPLGGDVAAASPPPPHCGANRGKARCYHHSMTDQQSITQLLNEWGDGDKAAEAALTPMVYDELQRLARRLFSGERRGHTLQPTALVHEAFVKLVGVEVNWQDRATRQPGFALTPMPSCSTLRRRSNHYLN